MPTSNALEEILAATTEAAASSAFAVEKETLPTTVIATGVIMAGAESGDLEISPDQGDNWISVLRGELAVGIEMVLDSDHTIIVIDFPGYFRINKEATVGAAGISIARPRNPGSA